MRGAATGKDQDSAPRAAEAIPDPEPLDAKNPPPIDRFCDLVLTGGVTDGVVYPWAILELARQYRFKNIGGTSVGAMAAALTAAAEYGRRHGSNIGFNEVLRKLPRELGKCVDGKNARLFTLFQPAAANAKTKRRSTQRLFDLFVSLFSPATKSREQPIVDKYAMPVFSKAGMPILGSVAKVFAKVIPTTLRVYWKPALAGLVVGVGIGAATLWLEFNAVAAAHAAWYAPGIWWIIAIAIALPCAFLAAVLLIARSIYLDLVRGVVPNGFGLCTGYRADGAAGALESLIEWLYKGIQFAAGKPYDQPLTFGDLWQAPGGPTSERPGAGQPEKPRSIDLRVVTTNLTHGRPYTLPLDDTTTPLYFKLCELQEFFPPAVMAHLDQATKRDDKFEDGTPLLDGLRKLPRAELPIVVAARLSLSFPFLFSRIPLWAIDHEADSTGKTLGRCAFSDGGICSNFPIHLFDEAVPRWPTFGILLSQRSAPVKSPAKHGQNTAATGDAVSPPHGRLADEGRVWLPQRHDEGHHDRWDRFAEDVEAPERFHALINFVKAIVLTAKDWNDLSTVRMPGVRDRVVRAYLNEGEAGLNLCLTDVEILRLAAQYGTPSGSELVQKFIRSGSNHTPALGWDEHRWVRFNTFLAALRERVETLWAAAEQGGYSTPVSAQIEKARKTSPLADPNCKALSEAQADDLKNLLHALMDLDEQFVQAAVPQPYKPAPRPALHIRPPP
jgi:predicted acylesterase/phospholipase RssA